MVSAIEFRTEQDPDVAPHTHPKDVSGEGGGMCSSSGGMRGGGCGTSWRALPQQLRILPLLRHRRTCIGQATLTGALFPACSPPGAPQPRGGAAAHHPAGPHPADPGAPDARQCEPAAVATAAAAAAAMTAPQYLPYLAPSPASMHASPGTAPSQPPCRPTLGTQTPTQSLTTPCWVSGRRWRGAPAVPPPTLPPLHRCAGVGREHGGRGCGVGEGM